MIVNGETGLLLLKIAHIIGEDELEDIDLESVSFTTFYFKIKYICFLFHSCLCQAFLFFPQSNQMKNIYYTAGWSFVF